MCFPVSLGWHCSERRAYTSLETVWILFQTSLFRHLAVEVFVTFSTKLYVE